MMEIRPQTEFQIVLMCCAVAPLVVFGLRALLAKYRTAAEKGESLGLQGTLVLIAYVAFPVLVFFLYESIAMSQLDAGRKGRSKVESSLKDGDFDKALSVARNIYRSGYKNDSLAMIAIRLAEAGRFDDADNVSREIGKVFPALRHSRYSVPGFIAVARTAAEQYAGIDELLGRIDWPGERQTTVLEIIAGLCESGRFERALSLADSRNENIESRAFLIISRSFLEADRIDDALNAVRKVVDPELEVGNIFCAAATTMIMERKYDVAEQILTEAVQRVRNAPRDWQRRDGLKGIVQTFRRSGEPEKGAVFLESLEMKFDESDPLQEIIRNEKRILLGEEDASKDDRQTASVKKETPTETVARLLAESRYDEAETFADRSSAWDRITLDEWIVDAFIKAGKMEAAQRRTGTLVAVVDQYCDVDGSTYLIICSDVQAYPKYRLSVLQAKVGRFDDALRTARQITMLNPKYRAAAFEKIVEFQITAGLVDDAVRSAEEIRLKSQTGFRVKALAKIAAATHSVGKNDVAEKLYDEAKANVDKIVKLIEQVDALLDLSETERVFGDERRSVATFRLAVEKSRRIQPGFDWDSPKRREAILKRIDSIRSRYPDNRAEFGTTVQ